MASRIVADVKKGNQKETKYKILDYTEKQIKEYTDNFSERNIIYEGKNSIIYKGIIDKEIVAIKKYTNNTKDFIREAYNIGYYEHENIVKMLGICFQPNCYIVVMEYMSKGSLRDYIDINSNHCIELQIKEILDMFIRISETLDYCHKKKLIHRDIKPSKILFNDQNRAKIAGFELSAFYNNTESFYSVSIEGTDDIYSDPFMRRSKLCGTYTDIYSLGMVIMTVICDKCKPMSVKRYVEKAIRGNMPIGKYTSKMWSEEIVISILEVASRCVNDQQEKRPSALELAKFFKHSLEKL